MNSIDETSNYLIEEMKKNELSMKHKKACKTLNYIEHLLILASTVIGCRSISTFTPIVGISVGIASSAIGIKICTITSVIKRCKAIIKKKKNKHDKIILLAKTTLITVEIFVYKVLINSNISHDEFTLINNVLKEYDDMKEKMKNPNNNIKCFFIVLNAQFLQKLTILK